MFQTHLFQKLPSKAPNEYCALYHLTPKKNPPVLLEMVIVVVHNNQTKAGFLHYQGPAHEDTWYHPQ